MPHARNITRCAYIARAGFLAVVFALPVWAAEGAASERTLSFGGLLQLSAPPEPLATSPALGVMLPLRSRWLRTGDVSLDFGFVLEGELWSSGANVERVQLAKAIASGAGIGASLDVTRRWTVYLEPRAAWLNLWNYTDADGNRTSDHGALRLSASAGSVLWFGTAFGHPLGIEVLASARFDRFDSAWHVTPAVGLGLTSVLLPEPSGAYSRSDSEPE